MKKYIYFLVLVLFVASCKAPKVVVEDPNGFIGNPSVNTCKLKGRIMSILPQKDEDTSTACGKHPCFAKVEIVEITDCGANASLPYQPGEIVEMQFVPTLQPTKNIMPNMRPRYPGLRRGDFFLSMVENRTVAYSKKLFIVSHYLRLL